MFSVGWIAPLPRLWHWSRFMAANKTGFLGGVSKCLHANKPKWPWLEFDLFVLEPLSPPDEDSGITGLQVISRLSNSGRRLPSFSTPLSLKNGYHVLASAGNLIVKPHCKCLTYWFSSHRVTAAGHAHQSAGKSMGTSSIKGRGL